MSIWEEDINRELDGTLGKSAGHICYSNFMFDSFCHQALLRAAHYMWENLRSAWLLEILQEDGTTIWLSPDNKKRITIDSEGKINQADIITE